MVQFVLLELVQSDKKTAVLTADAICAVPVSVTIKAFDFSTTLTI